MYVLVQQCRSKNCYYSDNELETQRLDTSRPVTLTCPPRMPLKHQEAEEENTAHGCYGTHCGVQILNGTGQTCQREADARKDGE